MIELPLKVYGQRKSWGCNSCFGSVQRACASPISKTVWHIAQCTIWRGNSPFAHSTASTVPDGIPSLRKSWPGNSKLILVLLVARMLLNAGCGDIFTLQVYSILLPKKFRDSNIARLLKDHLAFPHLVKNYSTDILSTWSLDCLSNQWLFWAAYKIYSYVWITY